ncbi:MAG: hypothetical protein R2734_08825 [Nocardioides sp.]
MSTRWCSAAQPPPLLTGVISYVMGDQVTLVSSAEECAKDVYRMLVEHDLMRAGGEPAYRFLTTGSPDEFEQIGRRFLAPELHAGPPAWSARVRLTVVGCSGLLPRPGVAGQLLPARGRALDGEGSRTWRVPRPRQHRSLGRAAPVRTRCRSTRCSCRTCTPTTARTCAATTSCASTCSRHGLQPRIPVRPRRRRGPDGLAYDLPEEPGMTQEFDFSSDAGPAQVGPFVVEPLSEVTRSPRAALRVSVDGAVLTYSGDTPRPAPSSTARRRGQTCSCARRPSAMATTTHRRST